MFKPGAFQLNKNIDYFYIVDRYSKSTNERVTSPKKIYIGDVGIKNIITEFKDLGASYENLVFLKIKDKNPNYYLENSVEIDFITKDSLIEAKYNQDFNEKQLKAFNEVNSKKKILANGYKFFLDWLIDYTIKQAVDGRFHSLEEQIDIHEEKRKLAKRARE